MAEAFPYSDAPFLRGGGEMGALTRGHDWSKTSLGQPDTWPHSLRSYLSLLLNSRFPMFLFWGREHICFYNDAYRPSLGKEGKHPAILGIPGRQAWPEIWDFIGPMIADILAGGEATWFEDQLVPIYRNGQMENVYWTFSYSPVSDESGSPAGAFVTCTETTKAVTGLAALTESQQRFQNLMRDTTVGLIVLMGDDLRVEIVNEAYCRVIGHSVAETLHKPIFEVVPEAEVTFRPVLESVLATGNPVYLNDAPYKVHDSGGGELEGYLNLVYQPYRETDGRIAGVMVVVTDVTRSKEAEIALRESEARFRSMVQHAPVAMLVLRGDDIVFETVNDAMLTIMGRDKSVIGQRVLDAMPEIGTDPVWEMLKNVYRSGRPFFAEEQPVQFIKDGRLTEGYFSFSFVPIMEEGRVTGILQAAVDMTTQVTARRALQTSETKLRSIVSTAPAAIGLFVGRDLIIENPNQTFIDIVGKGRGVEGLPLREAMPELITEGQPFLKILDDVYTSGIPFHSPGSLVKIVQNGVLTRRYYNITYTPVRNDAGKVYAILDVAIDVTEQIEARQKVEEAESAMRQAIELAELATWSLDLKTQKITYSPRLQGWLGVTERTLSLEASPQVHERDRERITRAVQAALAPGGSGIIDEVYTITHIKTGQHKIIHSSGRTEFDAEGKPLSISGVSQDVTIQRELQLALENEVQTRTEQLASAIEELRATNEELEQSNAQLQHSNDELAQYAYVASHDLQEPLRKIRVFTGMLKGGQHVPESMHPIVDKISQSAARMSQLIQDLLEFSRLLQSDMLMRPVALGDAVAAVWSDFELLAREKNARLEVGVLPVIQGISLQINQLFYNLISNALKFTAPGKAPEIILASKPVSGAELERFISRPFPFSNYHHITVSDNGIGFETTYNEQIFEVFKRLHGRDMYPGSGIGLALCRRIIANHHGFLYAESEPGKGSTFHMILPERQHEMVSDFPGSYSAFSADS